MMADPRLTVELHQVAAVATGLQQQRAEAFDVWDIVAALPAPLAEGDPVAAPLAEGDPVAASLAEGDPVAAPAGADWGQASAGRVRATAEPLSHGSPL